MKQAKTFIAFLVLINFVLNAEGLKFTGKEEGPCSIPNADLSLDVDWVKRIPIWYISGGSLYQLLRFASGHPFFNYARDFEFFYGLCPTCTLNFNTSIYATQGFGGSTGNYGFTLPSKGVFDLRPKPPVPGAGQQIYSVITLSDNKTFCFTYQCWTQTNQRGWILYTTEPNIEKDFQKEIEDHAVSLGFDRGQFQFLRTNLCGDPRYKPTCL